MAATVTISAGEARRSQGQNRQMVLYRDFLPRAASVVLLVGAVGIALGHPWGLAAVPVFVLVMFAIGLDNTWDLLLGDFKKRSFIDLKLVALLAGPDLGSTAPGVGSAESMSWAVRAGAQRQPVPGGPTCHGPPQ